METITSAPKTALEADRLFRLVFALRDVFIEHHGLAEVPATRAAVLAADLSCSSVKRQASDCEARQDRGSENQAATDLCDLGEVEALAVIDRLAAGSTTDDDLRRLAEAAKQLQQADGHRSLQEHLGLPSPGPKFNSLRRNAALAEAVALTAPDSMGTWVSSSVLAAEWAIFVSRGPWRHWRSPGQPGSDATPLQRSLFYATKFNGGRALSAKQLHRIVKHLW